MMDAAIRAAITRIEKLCRAIQPPFSRPRRAENFRDLEKPFGFGRTSASAAPVGAILTATAAISIFADPPCALQWRFSS